ncbi:hypothetical protein PISMIDRAFT_16995 [Pisolithus microcarpus 441]|uniref:Uncharacterized protein n=1 Tax=Pisolithus microcarpus 441 TaxID=765257 RepID=A0A0C9YDV0_9AGAM|nr:hypothetical protein PISMIDRAFT_16995 [Pisolithus microcarpus 441]
MSDEREIAATTHILGSRVLMHNNQWTTRYTGNMPTILGSLHTRSGLRVRQPDKVMSHRALVEEAAKANERRRAHFEAMSPDKREALEELCRSIPALEQTSKWGYDEPEAMTIDHVLDGTERLDISHGGREFLDLACGIMGDFMKLHGFSLLMADMVQSGELAKYPLAIISKLLEVFGKDLGGGYDIGCQFKTMLDQSPLGPLARSLNHTCLVGAFHGHAHRRLCQLDHLTTYTKGLGLEDLETCERTFSKSNALASTVQYASAFHRKQAISGYFKHNDDYEVYANLSKFLYDNYKQALDTIRECEATLPGLMKEQNVPNEQVFEKWLAEEKAYLEQLSRKPPEETLQMEYWEQLVKLTASKCDLDASRDAWAAFPVENMQLYASDATMTKKKEALRQHVLENYEKDLVCMQELERKLNIDICWKLEDAEWQCAGRLVTNREYQRALDRLEGYKLRKHIAKALQARSLAIQAALDCYNMAAHAMNLPRCQLHWDEVVEYAFLSEFNLLRDSQQDVSRQPWTMPAARLMMDWYFKKCHALDEVQRLNVEIHRFITYIQDEDQYLRRCEEQLRATHGPLAHQISIHRNVCGHFDTLHLKHLYNISQLRGFNGTLAPSISALKATGDSGTMPSITVPMQLASPPLPQPSNLDLQATDTVDELEEEEDIEENVVRAGCALQDVVHLTMDIEHTSGEE